MKVVLEISEQEIEKLNKAVGFPEDTKNAEPEEVGQAIHTLIDVCM